MTSRRRAGAQATSTRAGRARLLSASSAPVRTLRSHFGRIRLTRAHAELAFRQDPSHPCARFVRMLHDGALREHSPPGGQPRPLTPTAFRTAQARAIGVTSSIGDRIGDRVPIGDRVGALGDRPHGGPSLCERPPNIGACPPSLQRNQWRSHDAAEAEPWPLPGAYLVMSGLMCW